MGQDFFGKYEKPKILIQLEKYQIQNDPQWLTDGLGIDCECYYPCTPVDSIPFGRTGGDGNHFCFLTDFGRVKDLSEAPIIMVTPMSDRPTHLIAKNLTDFLSLILAVENPEILDADLTSPERINRLIKEALEWREENPERNDFIDRFKTFLKNDLAISPIDNAYEYLIDLRNQRAKSITIETLDTLGIITNSPANEIRVYDYDQNDLQKINHFLTAATNYERLKFYRDACQEYVLTNDYDNEIKNIVVENLKIDKLEREANMLSMA